MAVETQSFFAKVSKLRMAYRVLIFILTIVLLIAIYIWFIHLPKTKEIVRIQSDLKELERKIIIAKKMAKQMEKLELELTRKQEELAYAIRLLPTGSEIPSLLKGITKLGNDSNLEFLQFTPRKEVPKQFYMEIPVSIEVRGVYHDVALFFDKVGKLERIVNIADVTMKPIAESSTILTTSCSALTYSFKESKEQKDEGKKKK